MSEQWLTLMSSHSKGTPGRARYQSRGRKSRSATKTSHKMSGLKESIPENEEKHDFGTPPLHEEDQGHLSDCSISTTVTLSGV